MRKEEKRVDAQEPWGVLWASCTDSLRSACDAWETGHQLYMSPYRDITPPQRSSSSWNRREKLSIQGIVLHSRKSSESWVPLHLPLAILFRDIVVCMVLDHVVVFCRA